MKPLQLAIALCILGLLAKAQTITNYDLNGTVTGPSCLATGWQAVQYGEAACLATGPSEATPDLVEATGLAGGLSGNPYSGTTFMSGLYGGEGVIWHEGIKQNVSGFTPGQVYTLYFHQAVMKQNNAIDASGSWAVYLGNNLAGISPVCYNPLPYDSNAQPWYAVSVTFTASASSHVIRFLPFDNDNNHNMALDDSTGGLRMAIDNISFDKSLGFCEDSVLPLASLYPNPLSQQAVLKIQNAAGRVHELKLYNNSGQLARTFPGIRGDELLIDRGDLPAGIYFFVLESEGKPELSGRLSVE